MPPALRHTAGCPSGQRERSVKPSAQPTLVRTQHLPPPAKTAPWLRKRGPAGRFLLVTTCIRGGHYGAMRGSVYVHIVYSVRPKLAVRITARCADPRPFCPLTPAPGRSPDCYPRRIRPAGSLASCPRQAAGWACPPAAAGQTAGSSRAIWPGCHCRRWPGGAAAGAGDRYGVVLSDLGVSERSRHTARRDSLASLVRT